MITKCLVVSSLTVLCCSAALAQQNFVTGAMSTDLSSLCLSASGSIGNGTPIVVNDCISGHPSQLFALGADSRLHFGSATGSYCVGPSAWRLLSPLVLGICSAMPTVNTAGGLLAYMDSATNNYCAAISNNRPNSAANIVACSKVIVPSEHWTTTITARWASLNMSPAALFETNGCLVDHQGRPMCALGRGLVAVRPGQLFGNPGSWVTTPQGKTVTVANVPGNYGGNIVSQGAGNIVSQGAGNIILNGGGNLQIVSSNSSPVIDKLISQDGAGIVSQGAGNIVSQGAGNIVAAGAGNIVSTSGSNFSVQSAGGGINTGRGDTSVLNAFLSSLSTPAAAAYHITSVTADPGPWASGSQHRVGWLTTGSPAANQTVTVYFQVGTLGYPLCANISATQAACTAVANNTIPANAIGTLAVKDNLSGVVVYASVYTQIGTGAGQPFKLTGVTVSSANWAVGSGTYRIAFQSTGTATSSESLTVYYQSQSPTSSTVQLAMMIPATSGYYDYQGSSLSVRQKNTSGYLVIKDSITGQQVASAPIQIH